MTKLIERIQESLKSHKIDGWLFYSFKRNDPFAERILKFKQLGHGTRRCFYFVPSEGTPIKIVHAIEKTALDELEGDKLVYLSWIELEDSLKSALKGFDNIAMQYSPMNRIPYISCVDAGTVEIVKSLGKNVISAGELIQEFESILDEEQMESHKEACILLRKFVDEVFTKTAERLRNNIVTTEYDVQQMTCDLFKKHNMITSSLPVAGVNENSADPHYEPTKENSKEIKKGDFLLLDLWAKFDKPRAIYGDITWTCYFGDSIPEKYVKVFDIVSNARDSALNFIKERLSQKKEVQGWEVDDVTRNVIKNAGYGKYFIHRTGHSIGEEVHGTGVMIDNLETKDIRPITAGCCFSIEPGIYIEGDFGIRSEIDVFINRQLEPMCFSEPIQREVLRYDI